MGFQKQMYELVNVETGQTLSRHGRRSAAAEAWRMNAGTRIQIWRRSALRADKGTLVAEGIWYEARRGEPA